MLVSKLTSHHDDFNDLLGGDVSNRDYKQYRDGYLTDTRSSYRGIIGRLRLNRIYDTCCYVCELCLHASRSHGPECNCVWNRRDSSPRNGKKWDRA